MTPALEMILVPPTPAPILIPAPPAPFLTPKAVPDPTNIAGTCWAELELKAPHLLSSTTVLLMARPRILLAAPPIGRMDLGRALIPLVMVDTDFPSPQTALSQQPRILSAALLLLFVAVFAFRLLYRCRPSYCAATGHETQARWRLL